MSYVVFDRPGGSAAVIDSVLDYDPKSGRTRTRTGTRTRTVSADRLVRLVKDRTLTLEWILETHAHADQLSAAHYLRRQLGGRSATCPRCRSISARAVLANPPADLSGARSEHIPVIVQIHKTARFYCQTDFSI